MDTLPTLRELGFDGQFDHVVLPHSDFVDLAADAAAATEAQLAEVYALEVYREEIRRAEQLALDEAVALSLYAKEERKLLHPTDGDEESDEDDSLVLVNASDLLDDESKPPPNCTCCLAQLAEERSRWALPCGHLYCIKCVTTRCRMGVRDRSMVPAHCCKKEFPVDYVREVLTPTELQTYQRFLADKPWRSLDLHSDREYARVVQQNQGVQCPGCGVGVQRVTGCNRMQCLNHHEFCFQCGRQWKTCNCAYY